MKSAVTTPKKLRNLMIISIIGIFVTFGITFLVYGISRNTAKSVGIETVPQIIAAQNIKATLAGAHSNAMNAMVTGEKLSGKFWSQYRRDLGSLHSQLVDASRNISFGDEEQIPLTTISSNISTYEYTVGGAVANGAQLSVDQFMEANRLMQQKILPASTALNKVNLTQLEETFGGYSDRIDVFITIMVLLGTAFLGILGFIQIYLYKNTHRILNRGLLLASIMFLACLIYSGNAMNSVKGDLYSAKHDAFDSINALWNAKAVAYNAKSIESLYLLHEGTGIVQTADNINFDLSSSRIYSEDKEQAEEENSEGYLNIALSNLTFSGEKEAAENAHLQWQRYVEANKRVRSLEYDSKHDLAVSLSVGENSGQSGNEFQKFDEAITETIKINQENFDSSISSAFRTLNLFPFVVLAFMGLITAACVFGMKARLNEYRV